MDLSKEVVIGEPVQKTPLHWVVPYNVKDLAGNAAATVWRDVIVEEVDLEEFETKLRRDLEKSKQSEITGAVTRAVEDDRKKRGRTGVQPKSSCPPCPSCQGGKLGVSACEEICMKRIEGCAINEHSFVIRLLLWLEKYFPASVGEAIVALLAIFLSIVCLLFAKATMLSPVPVQRNYYAYEEQEHAMRNAVNYHSNNDHGGGIMTATATTTTGPPRSSMSTNESFFSPRGPPFSPSPRHASNNNHDSASRSNVLAADSIYDTGPIISPNKRGDGVRWRSPHDRY